MFCKLYTSSFWLHLFSCSALAGRLCHVVCDMCVLVVSLGCICCLRIRGEPRNRRSCKVGFRNHYERDSFIVSWNNHSLGPSTSLSICSSASSLRFSSLDCTAAACTPRCSAPGPPPVAAPPWSCCRPERPPAPSARRSSGRGRTRRSQRCTRRDRRARITWQ